MRARVYARMCCTLPWIRSIGCSKCFNLFFLHCFKVKKSYCNDYLCRSKIIWFYSLDCLIGSLRWGFPVGRWHHSCFSSCPVWPVIIEDNIRRFPVLLIRCYLASKSFSLAPAISFNSIAMSQLTVFSWFYFLVLCVYVGFSCGWLDSRTLWSTKFTDYVTPPPSPSDTHTYTQKRRASACWACLYSRSPSGSSTRTSSVQAWPSAG